MQRGEYIGEKQNWRQGDLCVPGLVQVRDEDARRRLGKREDVDQSPKTCRRQNQLGLDNWIWGRRTQGCNQIRRQWGVMVERELWNQAVIPFHLIPGLGSWHCHFLRKGRQE